MRLLVFCGTREALNKFDADPEWEVIASVFPTDQIMEIMARFRANPEGKLAVTRRMLLGWRVPEKTMVLFHPSWPYPPGSPENWQAVARVGYGGFVNE